MSPQLPLKMLFLTWHHLLLADPTRLDESALLYLAEAKRLPNGSLSRRQQIWLDRLHELERFLHDTMRWPHSNSRSPVEATEERLANWVRYQRKRENSLGQYQAQRLETLSGFSWAPLEDLWDTNLQCFSDFVEGTGRHPLKRSTVVRERRLANWRESQRRLGKAGRLPAHRIAAFRTVVPGERF